GVFFDHDKGKTHSSGKLLYSARIIPYRGSWLDFEFDPKDLVFVRIDRRRKLPATVLLRALDFTSQEILAMFYENDTYKISGKDSDIVLQLVPTRLRGEVVNFPIADKKGDVIVEEGRRITARHIRQRENAKVSELQVGHENPVGQSLANDTVEPETGEIVYECNTQLTEEVVSGTVGAGARAVETTDGAALGCGPFLAEPRRVDPAPASP